MVVLFSLEPRETLCSGMGLFRSRLPPGGHFPGPGFDLCVRHGGSRRFWRPGKSKSFGDVFFDQLFHQRLGACFGVGE